MEIKEETKTILAWALLDRIKDEFCDLNCTATADTDWSAQIWDSYRICRTLFQGNQYAPSTSSQNSASQSSVSQYGPSFGSSAPQQPASSNSLSQYSPGVPSISSPGSYNSGISNPFGSHSSISTNLNMIESMIEYHFSISNLVQYSVDEILNYGCWCQLENPDLYQYHKGPPVDNIDRKCQNRKRCHKCITMGKIFSILLNHTEILFRHARNMRPVDSSLQRALRHKREEIRVSINWQRMRWQYMLMRRRFCQFAHLLIERTQQLLRELVWLEPGWTMPC